MHPLSMIVQCTIIVHQYIDSTVVSEPKQHISNPLSHLLLEEYKFICVGFLYYKRLSVLCSRVLFFSCPFPFSAEALQYTKKMGQMQNGPRTPCFGDKYILATTVHSTV